MKTLSLLFALALATPAFAQDATPAGTATTTYPPCTMQVTDQCKEMGGSHGRGHWHGHGHGHAHAHAQGHHAHGHHGHKHHKK